MDTINKDHVRCVVSKFERFTSEVDALQSPYDLVLVLSSTEREATERFHSMRDILVTTGVDIGINNPERRIEIKSLAKTIKFFGDYRKTMGYDRNRCSMVSYLNFGE